MLAELENDFSVRELANFLPVLGFFRRRLATESQSRRAAETICRLAQQIGWQPDSYRLVPQLKWARSLLLSGAAGPERTAFGGSAAAVAFASLRGSDREILMLALWDGLRIPEISGLLDQNRWRVQWRLRLARRAYAVARAGGSTAADSAVGCGFPTVSELQAIDPAHGCGAAAAAEDVLLGRRILKKIADNATIFTDEHASGAGGGVPPASAHRSAWPVLAMAETAALLVLGASDLKSVWPLDGQEQFSRDAEGFSSAPLTLRMPTPLTLRMPPPGTLRSGAIAAHGGARPISDGIPTSGCAVESVCTMETELLGKPGQPMRPWHF
ncbi:hypothetical protein IV498_10035 [Paenarthrobacter sp. Z7-10]|uniref:hypothetical protein n=1 Tax=Paenarthrobacter sp. Z7-10 TaxID=2787635 RepID=UPI0022A97195|nr:hypothetical protein [Paenarthrobacter sp. Z7-10]MCZ2403511.1 hypothetical protein [Paenarthrobacter sp. Z7-10]